MSKRASIRYSPTGKLEIINLQGVDKLDPGNYKAGEGCLRSVFACAAAEFGDEKIKNECLAQLDNEYFPVEATTTGSLKNKGLSTVGQGTALRARLIGYQDWTNMMTVGPAKSAFAGPILADAKFPDVLVAKAFSHDGVGLEMVLYNGKKSGTFTLGLERLKPGQKYEVAATRQVFIAESSGKAELAIAIKDRTVVEIKYI
jgi:hypothetical protein